MTHKLARVGCIVLCLLICHASADAQSRPNILWITADDMSPDMGCYGDGYAVTPYLDGLAAEGVRYTNTFAVHGQCAPSRSALITGMYPTTIGTHHMRCAGIPPAEVKCFTEFLRAAGYYCTNNAKTDYNFGHNGQAQAAGAQAPLGAWDESSNTAHWRNRHEGAPFFAVFNLAVTHESRIFAPEDQAATLTRTLAPEERHLPDRAPVPPYYPDDPVVRHDIARYYDLVTVMDKQAGDLLRQLDEDGLAKDTIVFFFSDNGRGLPRAKRWLYDSGIRVPLMVRWPDGRDSGTVSDRLISFIDFAPTVLNLAGIEIPAHIQGKPFLGPNSSVVHEYIGAARDRYDEVVDFTRALRDKRYKYIRTWHPEIPYAVEVAYMDQMPMMKRWRELNAEGALSGPAAAWFAPARPAEELYDVVADPFEINNLAALSEHAAVLDRMRNALDDWQKKTADLGFVSESELWEQRRPGGVWATTANPVITITDGRATITCSTEGSTIVYLIDSGEKPQWKLYTGPVPITKRVTLRAQAGRIGYLDSEAISTDL